MRRFVLGLLVVSVCIQVYAQNAFSGVQLVGKYWLYIKDADLKTEEYFEIKHGEGQSYVLVWPDQSMCKLLPEGGAAYHLECKDEKLKIIFDETVDKKIKGFTIHLANEKMYGLKND